MFFSFSLLSISGCVCTELAADTGVQHMNNSIHVTVDGQYVEFDGQNPITINGRTLVPIRGVFEALGFSVNWEQSTQQAGLTKGNDVIAITVGKDTFTLNGASHSLDVPAQIIGGRIMLPVRAVAESVGYNVKWNNEANTIAITTRNLSDTVHVPPAQTHSLEQLANASTDIVIAHLSVWQSGNSPEAVKFVVNGSYKGEYESFDEIEVSLPDGYSLALLQEFSYFLLFLETDENGTTQLVNKTIYRRSYNEIRERDGVYYTFHSIVEHDYPDIEITYGALLSIWDNYLQSLAEKNAMLNFSAMASKSGVYYPPENPAVFVSLSDFDTKYEGIFYRLKEDYTEEFFSEKFLLIAGFDLFSDFLHLDVDAVLENGDVFISQYMSDETTADDMVWCIMIEIDNRIIPKHFNMVVNRRMWIK
jgi:hypothetical protein